MKATSLIPHMRKVLRSKISADVPYKLLVLVFANMFFFSLQQTMPFSFLPKWVRSFGVGEVDVGRQAGIIASSCYIGTCLSSVMWGYVGDKFSKKYGIVIRFVFLVIYFHYF